MDFMHGFIVSCRIANNLIPVYKDLRQLTGTLHAPAEYPLQTEACYGSHD